MTPGDSGAPPGRGRLSAGLVTAYALPAFALAVVGIPVYVYLPKFYTDEVGVSVGVVGALLLALRLFDAVTDPLMGAWSDRVRSRWGRRRPFIAAASVPLAASLVLLFRPAVQGPVAGAVWMGAALFALFLFWTAVAVPYEALGAEITSDYDARTLLMGARDGALILGTLAAAASPAAVGWVLGRSGGPAGEGVKLFGMAVVYAPLLVVASWVCALRVKEPRREPAPMEAGDWRHMLRNRPFLILLAAYAVSAFGSNLPATLILYYVEYVLGSRRADLFLLLYFASGILCLPLWLALARRWGKKPAWLAAMGVNTLAFAGVAFLGRGDEAAYAVLVLLSGVGFGAATAIPSAIEADVIDYHELLCGKRREGQYVGVWAIVRKLTAAAGVGIALAVLDAVGYAPNREQSPQVVTALRVLYALVPCLCSLAAIGIAMRYPISRDVHARLLEAIRLRREGRAYRDPLQP